MSGDLANPLDQMVLWLYEQEPFKVSYHPAKLGGHRHSGNGDNNSLSRDLHLMTSPTSAWLGQKICMIAVTGSSLLKITNPTLNFFSEESSKNYWRPFKNFYLSLGTKPSFIFLPKSQRFTSSLPFNAIEMNYVLS